MKSQERNHTSRHCERRVAVHTVYMILLLLLGTTLLSSCVNKSGKITKYQDLNGKVIAHFAVPMPIGLATQIIESENDIKIKELLYFASTSGAVAALKTNKADAVMMYSFTGDYYTQRNDDLLVVQGKNPDTYYTVHMIMRAEDGNLLRAINQTIRDMRGDGSLDKLKETHITNLKPEDQLVGRDLYQIPGAETYLVGISGDIPPLDFITADGKPGGYSLEILSEISKRMNKNFEIVTMATEAKFTALAAKKIDLFFFHPLSDEISYYIEFMNANPYVVLTEPYITFQGMVYVVIK